jgi:hypothetical protein
VDDYQLGPCAEYCDAVMANCTNENSVYTIRENCMGVCALLEPGIPSEPGRTNTVACRHAAAREAATGEADIACQRAGPGGGDWCGNECENYCSLYSLACSREPEQVRCVEQCAGLRDNGKLHATDDHEGDSLQCRLVHVSSAPDDPVYHCGHARLVHPSKFCNDDAFAEPLLPTCTDFCKLVTNVCTGTLEVYEDAEQCKALCEHFDPGKNSDTSGQNTLGCRKYHAYNAFGDPVTHCPHVGPGGGKVCGDKQTGDCDSYCRIASGVCGSEFAAAFGDEATCLAECAVLEPGSKYSIAKASTEPTTLGCRLMALAQAAEGQAVCPAAFGNAAPCQ